MVAVSIDIEQRRAAEAAGRGEEAIGLGRRASELEPDQEGGWRRLMTLQDRLGDRAGALRTYDELAARLRSGACSRSLSS